MTKLGLLACSLGVLAVAALAAPADAQTINPKARQKTTWYNAPREIQIIDERPVIKDFREAPAAAQGIQLPPGPQAGGGFGGGGGGALGDDGGGTIPAGGIPIGGAPGQQGYRNETPGGPLGLPKADFGHRPSNIPAGGLGPKGPLPGGYTTNRLAGQLKPWSPGQGVNPNVGRPMGRQAAAPTQYAAPAATYNPGGGYGPSVGGGSYGGGGSSTSVSARLLKKVK
jgi:hypothetical protein